MYKIFFKSFFDFIIVFTPLLITKSIFWIVTVWLHFTNKGTGTFFFQERLGNDETIFKVIQVQKRDQWA